MDAILEKYFQDIKKLREFKFIFVLFMGGLMFLVMGYSELAQNSVKAVDFNTLDKSNYQQGLIIEGKLENNWGVIEENYRTMNGIKVGSTEFKYLFCAREDEFMCFVCDDKAFNNKLAAQMDVTNALWFGTNQDKQDSLYFKGYLTSMDEQTRKYIRDFLLEFGYAEQEVDNYILDYCIVYDEYNGYWWKILLGIVFIGGGILYVGLPLIKKNKTESVSETFDGLSGGNSAMVGTVIEDDFETFQQNV